MSDKPVLVTCGLPYTNGPCHIGHLRTYVPADFYVRYMRRAGEQVVFVCGSDNHGTPIVISAEQAGTTPQELSERYHRHFDETFRRMHVIFDHFGMTDGPVNHHRTQAIVKRLIERGYVYAKTISQSYCPRCRRFLPDRYVEGVCPHCGAVARGDECDQGCGQHLEPGEITDPVCKLCGENAELRDQEHYFFQLSKFKDFLLEYLPHLKGTSNARNYALGWVRGALHDWCITRTLEWGVEFPGQDGLVVYVWVDAPIGYISFTEEYAAETGDDWKRYWCGDTRVTHFIGGDIIYHHCIFWPALLQGAGYGSPYAVVASGMVKIDDKTFSKSRGYVVWTNDDYLDHGLPADYLRYYLLSYTNHTKELNFSWQVFQERVNNEIVGTFGNFIYRTMFFAHSKFGGVPDGAPTPAVTGRIASCLDEVDRYMKEYEFKNAVDAIMGLASFGNTYIQHQAPWKVIKEDPEAATAIMKDCFQIVKALLLLCEPLMPESAQKAWEMCGFKGEVGAHAVAEALKPMKACATPAPTPLFVKIEDETIEKLDMKLKQKIEVAGMAAEKEDKVSFEEFRRMDLRTARVISAEAVPKSKKLLKLKVDIGTEERQIIAGIAGFYTPEDLMGKDIVVIANLEPAQIFGLESNGMLLAAGDEASLLVPFRRVGPGTKIG